MRKYVLIAALLFVLHTAEEALFRFWNSDSLTLALSNALHLAPGVVYWSGQILFYTFLMSLLCIPRLIKNKILLTILGLLLLFEFQHLIIAAQSGQYQPGLITGVILAFYGILYGYRLIKNKI